jgi:hypothetical protein
LNSISLSLRFKIILHPVGAAQIVAPATVIGNRYLSAQYREHSR